MRFADRRDAGRRLAALLGHLAGPEPGAAEGAGSRAEGADGGSGAGTGGGGSAASGAAAGGGSGAGRGIVVLALPRGGVPVAFEVARVLDAPLDVVVVRKLGAPHQPELAMGAIGEGGVRLLDPAVARSVGASDADVAAIESRERAELARRAVQFRGDAPPMPIDGRVAVIVDDGIATGSSARVACRIVRARGAARVVLAVPVAPERWTAELRGEADEFVCVHTPRWYRSVGEWYQDFTQTTDAEVISLLAHARH